MNRTWIELNASALNHNISTLAQLIAPSQFGAVIKANAYGHGLVPMAQLVDKHPQVSWICVAGIEEALIVRSLGITKPVLTLAYRYENLDEAVQQNIAITVYDEEMIALCNTTAFRLKKAVNLHIKIDTGMSRLGFTFAQFNQLVTHIAQRYPYVVVQGLMTHVCDKDNNDQQFTLSQFALFDKTIALYQKPVLTQVISSGVVDMPQAHNYNFARVGTNMYGFWSSAAARQRAEKMLPTIELKPVMTWKARIIHIKSIPAGAFVGYGCTYQAQRSMRIAILPVGYYDGYARNLSNKSRVLVHNTPVSVLGIVSMNLIAIDVTDVPAHVGDEVILLGNHPAVHADTHAALLNTINIAFTTGINPTIDRIIV